MGCTEGKEEEINELKKELSHLTEQNKMFEFEINKNNKTQNPYSFLKNLQTIIDEEQHTTRKLIEFFFELSGNENEFTKTILQKISDLLPLEIDEKIMKYSELRSEETKIQSDQVKSIKNFYDKFLKVLKDKCQEIETRVQTVKEDLKFNSYFSEEFELIELEFSYLEEFKQSDFEYLINKLDRIFKIDSSLNSIEKHLPRLNTDAYFLLKIKELEASLGNFKKISENNLKNLEYKFGMDKTNTQSVVEINLDTFETLLETLNESIKGFIKIETNKESILENEKTEETLEWLENTLTLYFNSSQNSKENILSKLKRLGVQAFPFISSLTSHIKINHDSLPLRIEALKEKIMKYLANSEKHDQSLAQMTESFLVLEQKIDNFELKLDEIISADLKDLQKVMILTDTESKNLLENLKQEFSKSHEEISKDLNEHMDLLYKKIEKAMEIETLREKIRDLQIKEMNKVKQEFQDKLHDLNTHVALLENEKSNLQNSNFKLKATSEKASEIAEKVIVSIKEKEQEIATLKNQIFSLQEQYDQLYEKTPSQTEIEELTKENHELKKTLRLKEREKNTSI